jgi:O-antigen ligase/tetratricopeptide (TPR) repeat protein
LANEAVTPTPTLVRLTDVWLFAAITVVPAMLGGRTAAGQLALMVVALLAWTTWSLHQLTSRESRWERTGSEWLWALALAWGSLQVMTLSPEWLNWLSPSVQPLLSEWADGGAGGLFNTSWPTLSLAPAETQLGLAILVALVSLFIVAAQRIRTQKDVELWLTILATVSVVMAVFSLIQFGSSNGKFYWVLQHPFVSTDRYNLGSFTNRNHLAHFLALGVGPLLWLWCRVSQRPASTSTMYAPTGVSAGSSALSWSGVAVMLGLGAIVIATVLTLSRGGLLALCVTSIATIWGLVRAGRLSTRLMLGLLLTGGTLAGAGWAVGHRDLAQRIDEGATEDRLIIWNANWEIIRAFPWTGTGPGSHLNSHQLFLDREYDRHEYTHAESSYLQVASETGLVGLAIAACLVCLLLWWTVLPVLKGLDADRTAAAAALLGLVLGHLLHATVDFVWYVPGLMTVVAVAAAAAYRLHACDRQDQGRALRQWPLPRWSWAASCAALIWLAPWLTDGRWGAAAAEPHWRRFLTLVYTPWELFPDADDPEVAQLIQREKTRSVVQAAKADPRGPKVLQAISGVYLRAFEDRQMKSDLPLNLIQIRDTVRSSEFASAEECQSWLKKALGPQLSLLQRAWQANVRAVKASPLEGPAYITLAELSFLYDPSGQLKSRLLKQALAVRPYDPHVQLAVGEEWLLEGDLPRALTYWQQAFKHGESFQRKVARVIANALTAQQALDTFSPDWEAAVVLTEAFRMAGRSDELPILLSAQAQLAIEAAREQAHGPVLLKAWGAARHAYLELQRPDLAIITLQEAVEHNPHELSLRRDLGTDLFHQHRYTEAAEHLSWAAKRHPDDADLVAMAERAVDAALRQPLQSQHDVQPAGFQQPTAPRR